jgi:ribosome-associated protein
MTGALRAPARPTAAQAAAAASQGDALSLVLSSLEDDKAEDVVAIDLRGKSAIADHMVIATGRSARQVTAIAEKLGERFKERFQRAVRAEGRALGDWVLVDCGDVIVHVFRPEVRAFYQIEKMWMDPADLRARAAAAPRPVAPHPAEA